MLWAAKGKLNTAEELETYLWKNGLIQILPLCEDFFFFLRTDVLMLIVLVNTEDDLNPSNKFSWV